MRKTILGGAAALAAVAFASSAGAANIFLDGVSPSGSGSNFFSYRIEFTPNEGVTGGSRLVILDFAGYVPGSITSGGAAGISAFVENTSSALIGVPGLSDDPGLPNLVFTYGGATIDLSGTTFTGFGALSTFGATVLDGFQARTIKTGTGAAGTDLYAQGTIGVPGGVPEPATWAMLIGGLGLVGYSLRRRASLQTA